MNNHNKLLYFSGLIHCIFLPDIIIAGPDPPPFQCPPGLPYKCLDGQMCLSYDNVCDYIYHCPDKSDEGAFCNPGK